MTFALDRVRELAARGPVARVVVAGTRGSVPREVGAAILVTDQTVEGTVGGGALEFEAIGRARDVLRGGGDRLDRLPLGPALGQCCGGSVTLLTEVWTMERLAALEGDLVVRRVPGVAGARPLAVSRIISEARSRGALPGACLVDGWMVEPVQRAIREIWIWGAGHVGRAIAAVAAPLPGVRVRWADTDKSRFPKVIPAGVDVLIAANPPDLVTLAPRDAEHLVLTYSHAVDLELCHRILSRPFRSLGLIGSATKRARFRSRLAVLGHAEAQIDRIVCPIGDPALGKHPQAIALGVALDIVRTGTGKMAMIGQSA